MKLIPYQRKCRHVVRSHRHISRTYQDRLRHTHRMTCHIRDTSKILRYSHRNDSSLCKCPCRRIRWCRSSLHSPSWTIHSYIFRNFSCLDPNKLHSKRRDIVYTTIYLRPWTLHSSHHRMLRNSLRNILYHSCIFRCPFAFHFLCRLRCQSSRCKLSNLFRNDWRDNKLSRCRCRTTWRNLKEKIENMNNWVTCKVFVCTTYLDTHLDVSTIPQCHFHVLQPSFDIVARLLWCQCKAFLGSQPSEPRWSCSCQVSSPPNQHRHHRAFHVVFFLSPTSVIDD